MPQLQVVDLGRGNTERTAIPDFFNNLAKAYKEREDTDTISRITEEYKKNRNDINAWEDYQLALENSDISPTRRVELQKRLNETKKVLIDRDKQLNKRAKDLLSPEELEVKREQLRDAGFPEYDIDRYIEATPGVQQIMEREHAELVARGLRKPRTKEQPQQPPTQNELTEPSVQQNPTKENLEPRAPEQKATQEAEVGQKPSEVLAPPKIEVKKQPVAEKEEWPEIPVPQGLTPKEKVALQNKQQTENSNELKKYQEKRLAASRTDVLLKDMTRLNESKKLPSGIGKAIIDPENGDVRPYAQIAGLVNKETALYAKHLKQFLKGAKEYFGGRVTNFDVGIFMEQLPNLLNSEDGRRLILKQMDLVNQLESVHTNEMHNALKHYGRNAGYADISKVVDERVAAKEENLLRKVNLVVEASNYMDQMAKNPDKFRGMVLMEKDGKFNIVREKHISTAEGQGWSRF